jgi:uncharacterized protein YoaH (UPF0181 family)
MWIPHLHVIHIKLGLAKERVLEFYNQGMDLGEAVAKVSGELSLTDGMIAKALEHNVPPSPDEMRETITPTRRGNTLDPEVRKPRSSKAGRVITLISSLLGELC